MPEDDECGETSPWSDPLSTGAYVGAVARSMALPSCHVSTIVHPRSRVLPEHAHDWPFICVLLKGSYVSRTRTRETEVTNDVAIYHPRAFQHCDAIGRDGGVFFGVQLNPALLDEADVMRRRAAGDIAHLDDDHAYVIISSLLCSLLAGADTLMFEALAAELAAGLVVPEMRGRGAPPAWLSRVEARLREEAHISLAALSRDAGVHATTLTRLFRQHKRCSVGEFHARSKAKCAFLGVVGGTAPLAEISLAAGYADQSHMTREFKKMFRHTPGEIRRLVFEHVDDAGDERSFTG